LRRYLLPWIGNDAGQAVLSWGHLLDILNEILLVFPAAVLFLGLLWSAGGPIPWVRAAPPPATVKQPSQSRRFHGKRRQLSAPDTTPVQWLRTRAEWQFFGLGAWGCLLYLLFFEAAIGVARDWDLFSMIAVPLVPLALIAWNRHMHIAGGFDAHKYAIVVTPMLTMTLVMCLSWVVLNHSVGRAAQRFEWILGWESARVAYGLEALAATYYDHGHPGDAVRVMERAIVVSPNKRLRSLLAPTTMTWATTSVHVSSLPRRSNGRRRIATSARGSSARSTNSKSMGCRRMWCGKGCGLTRPTVNFNCFWESYC
jgi:hypothetical protein